MVSTMANQQEQYNDLLEIVKDFCKDVREHVVAKYSNEDHSVEIDVESYASDMKCVLLELEKIKLMARKSSLEEQLRLMPNAASQLKDPIQKEIDYILQLVQNPILIDIYEKY